MTQWVFASDLRWGTIADEVKVTPALADGDDVSLGQPEAGRDVGGNVAVPLLVPV